MAWAQKDLSAVGNTLAITNPHQGFAWAHLSYDSTGVGTVILEGSIDGIQFDLLFVTVRATGVGAASMTTPGLYECDVSGLAVVRARKTVGVASCIVRLSVSEDT